MDAALSFHIHPRLDNMDVGYQIPPSFASNVDSQEVVSGIRCALREMISVPVAGEIAKACRDAVGALVALFENFLWCWSL